MGHNVSDRRARSWSLAESEGAPPGWRRVGHRLEHVDTAAGLLARGGIYAGRCQDSTECSRRVTVDLAWWVEHGFGGLPLHRLTAVYACARLEGCGLKLMESYPNGVPLMRLLQESAEIALEFACLGCGWCRLWPVGELIERLAARGHGGPNTSCNTLGERAVCPRCKARKFETVIRRPRAQGQG